MIDFKIKGAIFDVDDTLLDNQPGIPGLGLHERARLAAARQVGLRRGVIELEAMSIDDNQSAFVTASVHTLQAAVWNMLFRAGLVDSEVINPTNDLLVEIVALKDGLYKDILIQEGQAVVGATDFVAGLAASGLSGALAIASSAIRRDVDIFLAKTGLAAYFPDSHILTLESITRPKPNPEVFNLAFAALNLSETDRAAVCAFEDDPRGIMSARAAGLYVCAITTRYSRSELESLAVAPDLVADSFAEFSRLFGISN